LLLAVLTFFGVAPLAQAQTTTWYTNVYGGFTNTWTPAGGVSGTNIISLAGADPGSIQVECWGGGGGSGGAQSQGGAGGGGGGAYSKMTNLTATAGLTYYVAVPTAAAGGAQSGGGYGGNGGTALFYSVTSGGVTNVIVAAAGGGGGQGANHSIGAGGAGGTNVPNTYNVQFNGGNGASGYIVVSTGTYTNGGAGGTGASDLAAGVSALGQNNSNSIPGIAGSDALHSGGNGGGGGYHSAFVATQSSAAGIAPGGGAGASGAASAQRVGSAGGLGQVVVIFSITSSGATSVKANNANALNLTNSWSNATVPTVSTTATWDSTVTGANTTVLGATLSFGGIVISNPAGLVTIGADGNSLTLGSAGIDMSSATADLTLNCPVSLGSPQTWNVAGTHTLTLGGQVSGISALTTAGAGKLVFTNANNNNTFSALTIGGSTTVQMGATNALSANCVVNASSGTLDMHGYTLTVGGLNGSGGTVDNLVGGNLTLEVDNTINCTNSAAINNSYGSISLLKKSGGTLTLASANGYSGGTTISGGVLVAGANSALSSGSLLINSNAVGFGISSGVTVNNPITVAAASGVASQGVIYATAGGTATVSSPITISASPGAGALFGAGSGSTLVVSGSVTSSVPVTLRTGTVQFSSTSSVYSNLNIGGTFQLGAANVIPAFITPSIGVLAAGFLDLNGFNQTLSGVVKGASFNGTITNSSATPATLTLTSNSFCGCIIGDTGSGLLSLTVTNGGTVTLTNNNPYSGATTISLGRLEGQVGGSCANSAITVADAAATLGVNVNDPTKQWTCQSLTTAGAGSTLGFDFGVNTPGSVAPLVVSSSVTFNGTPTVVITGTSLPVGNYPLMTCASGIPGTIPNLVLPTRVVGNLSSDGFTLTLNITAAGPVEPLLWATGNGTWNTSSVNWVDSTTPTPVSETYADGDWVVFEDSKSVGSGPLTVTLNSTVTPVSVTNNSAKSWIISGTGGIAGTGGLTKQGSGTLTVATTNTFTGRTIISAGTLSIGADSNLGTAPVTTNATAIYLGGTLSANNTLALPSTRGITLITNSTPVLDVAAGKTLTCGGIIAGATNASALTKTGTGTLVLAASNTYTNGTTISAGNVSIQGAAPSGNYSIASGSTLSFDTTNADISSGTYSGAGTLKLANSMSFNKSGNTYVTLSAGGLVLVTSNATVAGSASQHGFWTNNFATLQVDAGSSINFSEAGSTATANPAQFDALNGAGVVTIGWSSARTLVLGAANGSGSFSGNLANGATNTIMALQKIGTGIQTLSGSNSYTGSTTISGGTLALSGIGSISNSPNIIVSGGATFDVSGKTTVFALGTRTLTNSSVGAIINGTNDCTAGTISLLYDATNACFIVTNGGMTLSASTAFKVNNTGPALGIGAYKVIAKAASGNVGSVAGTAPSSVTLGGSGRVANVTAQPLLQIVGSELYLDVPPAPPSVANNGPITAGATLLLTATNSSGGTYAWTGPNGFTSALQNPSIVGATTAASGNYNCTVTVNGVTSATATTTVTVNPSVSTPATISSVRVDGSGNLIITGTNGSASGTYSVLTSTNLTAPLSTWVTNTTGSFTGSGSFSNSIPVSGTSPQQFFNIKQP